jgi:hypothetical protein
MVEKPSPINMQCHRTVQIFFYEQNWPSAPNNHPGRCARRGNLNFNFIRDIAPVASVARTAFVVMEVNPTFPAQTVTEFIDYAKANPGRITMASGGNGNMSSESCSR